MIKNYNCINLAEANKILLLISGDYIGIINLIDYAEDDNFLLVKRLNDWEEKDDIIY